jgi:hypothetical protein
MKQEREDMLNPDFIEIYDNSVPEELCNELVEWFDLCSDSGFTVHNMPFADGREHMVRRTDENVTIPDNVQVSSIGISPQICNAVWRPLHECFNNYIIKYELGERLSCHVFKVHKVKKSQGFHVWHHETEGTENQARVLVWMTYLKVPDEGGETEFLHQSKRIEPVVGRTLIWPAYFTHIHRGNPPLKGEKYYITGWFERN